MLCFTAVHQTKARYSWWTMLVKTHPSNKITEILGSSIIINMFFCNGHSRRKCRQVLCRSWPWPLEGARASWTWAKSCPRWIASSAQGTRRCKRLPRWWCFPAAPWQKKQVTPREKTRTITSFYGTINSIIWPMRYVLVEPLGPTLGANTIMHFNRNIPVIIEVEYSMLYSMRYDTHCE